MNLIEIDRLNENTLSRSTGGWVRSLPSENEYFLMAPNPRLPRRVRSLEEELVTAEERPEQKNDWRNSLFLLLGFAFLSILASALFQGLRLF